MKKILLLVFSFLILPSVTIAEETVNNGDVVTPIGTISVYAGLESDTQLLERGYLIANGASLSRADYPELFAIIKDTYGASDEEHFNLPDLRGRTVVGMKSDDTDFNTLGKKGGEKTVTLTVEQIPSHTHTFTGTTSTSSTTHTHTFTATGTNASAGGGKAHNNMQPYIALKYIIKVK